MFETIEMTIDARGVATLLLNRPEKHNALSAQMIAELTQAARQLEEDPTVRVVLLTGAGKSFCAGGDLGWMREQIGATAEDRASGARALATMLGALDSMSKPVIGRVQGNAFGGGVGMACVCDKVFTTGSVLFGLTETRLGLIPATIGPYVIGRMGLGAARQVFMSARLFDAAEAARLGIVSVVADDLDVSVEAEVEAYLNCAPGAVAAAKALARSLGGAPTQEMVDQSIDALVACWEKPEAIEGITAFFDKTAPPWKAG